MCYTQKAWEPIEQRLEKTFVLVYWFGFMWGRLAVDAIFLLRQLMERGIKGGDYHLVAFVGLKEAYDKVSR